jgi:hypothetical protein
VRCAEPEKAEEERCAKQKKARGATLESSRSEEDKHTHNEHETTVSIPPLRPAQKLLKSKIFLLSPAF